MRTEDLIISLARSSAAVRVLPPAPARLARWAGLALIVAAIGIVVVGPRVDIAEALRQPRYVLLAAGMLAIAIVSASAAFVLNVPGAEWSPAQRLVPFIMATLWAVVLVVWLQAGGDTLTRIAALPIHTLCVAMIAGLGYLSGALITKMLARGASLHPTWNAALAWTAAAAIGALAAQIVCPIDDPAHHLAGHFGPFAIVAAVGAFVGRRSLDAWRRG